MAEHTMNSGIEQGMAEIRLRLAAVDRADTSLAEAGWPQEVITDSALKQVGPLIEASASARQELLEAVRRRIEPNFWDHE